MISQLPIWSRLGNSFFHQENIPQNFDEIISNIKIGPIQTYDEMKLVDGTSFCWIMIFLTVLKRCPFSDTLGTTFEMILATTFCADIWDEKSLIKSPPWFCPRLLASPSPSRCRCDQPPLSRQSSPRHSSSCLHSPSQCPWVSEWGRGLGSRCTSPSDSFPQWAGPLRGPKQRVAASWQWISLGAWLCLRIVTF